MCVCECMLNTVFYVIKCHFFCYYQTIYVTQRYYRNGALLRTSTYSKYQHIVYHFFLPSFFSYCLGCCLYFFTGSGWVYELNGLSISSRVGGGLLFFIFHFSLCHICEMNLEKMEKKYPQTITIITTATI